MATVRMIPPREQTPDTLRVAAYCRVSSDSSDQLHSYAAQIRKYTTKISEHDGWELVDIYADESVTGTRTDKREDFNRMLSDCRKGRIDKILVKSISRFARNTKDCLTALRELTALGVTVFFEKENISTETLTSELMVSVFGALAQEESISIGKNQRISYQRRMERGEFITCCAPFGYQLVDGKDLVIDKKEAEIVRWIFDSYLSGCSTTQITAELNRKKIPTVCDGKLWHQQVIKKYWPTRNTLAIPSAKRRLPQMHFHLPGKIIMGKSANITSKIPIRRSYQRILLNGFRRCGTGGRSELRSHTSNIRSAQKSSAVCVGLPSPARCPGAAT